MKVAPPRTFWCVRTCEGPKSAVFEHTPSVPAFATGLFNMTQTRGHLANLLGIVSGVGQGIEVGLELPLQPGGIRWRSGGIVLVVERSDFVLQYGEEP